MSGTRAKSFFESRDTSPEGVKCFAESERLNTVEFNRRWIILDPDDDEVVVLACGNIDTRRK